MRVYYVGNKILKVWREVDGAMPEDDTRTAINVPYDVIEIDEWYNRLLCRYLVRNSRGIPDAQMPDRFYVNGSGQLVVTDTDEVVNINPNPQKEAYKLSQLYGLTQEQLENYIENNITTLPAAKDFLKKLSAVVLWLIKQTRMEE